MAQHRKSGEWYERRRRQLRVALMLADQTVGEFAAELGVTQSHLNYVLRGLRASPRIDAAIAKRITRKA
jgi:hypothetical protein